MAYCHHNNVGRLIDGGLCGHVWNELDGDIIDFSSGDWLGEAALLAEFYPDGLLPLQSTVGPPDYLWQPAGPLKSAWRAMGRPALGQFWYGPWASEELPDTEEISDIVHLAMAAIRDTALRLGLRERINHLAVR